MIWCSRRQKKWKLDTKIYRIKSVIFFFHLLSQMVWKWKKIKPANYNCTYWHTSWVPSLGPPAAALWHWAPCRGCLLVPVSSHSAPGCPERVYKKMWQTIIFVDFLGTYRFHVNNKTHICYWASCTPEFITPPSYQLFVQPVNTGALTFDLLKMFLHFLPPFWL